MSATKKNFYRKLAIFGSPIFLMLVIILTSLEITNTTHLFHKKPTIATTAGQATKGVPTDSTNSSSKNDTQASTSNGSTDSSSQPGDQKGGTSQSDNEVLLNPTGNFVSNHRPGQNGSPITETSVCNTTPGATCKINFTKDGITKSLTAQTTDRGGATYWNNWTPTSIGLTSGDWTIQAVAVLNGQTATSTDSIKLTVE